jgi:hypothetical protein
MEIFVFKTNIETEYDAKRIGDELRKLTGLQRINFDLKDCDRILRVEAKGTSAFDVESLVQSKGFICVELH